MPKRKQPKTDITAASLAKSTWTVGLHPDDEVPGLYLRVATGGSRQWLVRYQLHGNRRDCYLGGYPDKSLKDARIDAMGIRKQVKEGIDPLAHRVGITFADTALQFIENFKASWKNETIEKRWHHALRTHLQHLGRKPVGKITSAEVYAALKPLWHDHPAKAKFAVSVISRTLDFAIAHEYRALPNYAERSKLNKVFPLLDNSHTNHAAISFRDLPAFVAALRNEPTIAKLQLEFIILTACRSNEARELTFDEIDGDVWTLPAARSKTKLELRIPLTPRAVAIIEAQRKVTGGKGFVFPGKNKSKPIGHTNLAWLMRDMKAGGTVHGMRSAFRDWASELHSFDHSAIELCLGHKTGSAVERAYRRSDMLDKRTAIMAEWNAWLG